MTRIVVVGGGISGLAAAWLLAERAPEAEVVVLEAERRIGGKLRSATVGGVRVDVGAEAMLARRPEGMALVRAAGLGADVIEPLTTSARVRAGGANHPLPARTMLGVPADPEAARASGVFTEHALGRIAHESELPPLAPLIDDVAVGALVRDRLGNEVADRLVEPLLGGVYAGRADEISLRAAVPALAHQLAGGGSLVRAAAAVVDRGAHNPASGPVFASVRGGLGRLPERLAAAGGFRVRTGVTVREIRRAATGFTLTTGPVPEPHSLTADAVVLATPAMKAALLLRELAPGASAQLRAIETASVAIITLAFDGLALPAAAGSGLLVGAREGFAVKAVTLSTNKWPIAADGVSVLRASLGRAGDARVLQREDGDLVRLVRHELRGLLGIDAEPVDALVTRWGGGLPQYGVGHVERVARIRAAVANVPGVAVCGASYDGIGIPACIATAQLAVDQVLRHLAVGGQ
jgi:oxygen-dependent protoporphyrinogen oxidase